MTAKGGSPRDCSIAGRIMQLAGDTDPERIIGGYSNEVEPNGDGQTATTIQTIVSPEVKGLNVVLDDKKGDQEFLQEKIDSGEFFDFSYTEVDNTTWGGRMQIVGELQRSGKSAKAQINLKGVGKLEKQ
jgi:hypothetical protein